MKALVAVLAVSPDLFRAPAVSAKDNSDTRRQTLDAVRWFAQAMALRPGGRTIFGLTAVKA